MQVCRMAAIISHHLHTIAFLPYDDKFGTARVQPRLLLKNKRLWQDMRRDTGKLRFSRNQCLQAFKTIRSDRTDLLGSLSEKASDDWVKTNSERFRAQASHIMGALSRVRKPKWLSEFKWDEITPELFEHDDGQAGAGGDRQRDKKPDAEGAKKTVAEIEDTSDKSDESGDESGEESNEEMGESESKVAIVFVISPSRRRRAHRGE